MHWISRLLLASLFLSAAPVLAGDKSDTRFRAEYQITGLFMPDREKDFREVLATIQHVSLVEIDYKNAEAIFEFIPNKAFPGAKPDQITQEFDNLLKTASHHTFGLKSVRTGPTEKLRWIEIAVVGLDCKACSLAAYEAVYQLEGVEQATASFKYGLVKALIDPEKTNRKKLEEALKKKGVQLKMP
jgi:copper chaperone CopZ